jgi:hypothetical protein
LFYPTLTIKASSPAPTSITGTSSPFLPESILLFLFTNRHFLSYLTPFNSSNRLPPRPAGFGPSLARPGLSPLLQHYHDTSTHSNDHYIIKNHATEPQPSSNCSTTHPQAHPGLLLSLPDLYRTDVTGGGTYKNAAGTLYPEKSASPSILEMHTPVLHLHLLHLSLSRLPPAGMVLSLLLISPDSFDGTLGLFFSIFFTCPVATFLRQVSNTTSHSITRCAGRRRSE